MKMLPRLHAEEQLSAIEATGLASGNFEAHDARTMTEKLRQTAGGRAHAASAKRAEPDQLAAMGIAMTVVEPGQNNG